MNISRFLFDSAYQLVTWVFIGASIASLFYFLGKESKKGIIRSLIGLLVSIIIMLGLLAYRYIVEARTLHTTVVQPEKQYVSIVASSLTALSVGTPPTLTITLQNGPGKTTVNFHEVNFLVTTPTKHLKYAPSGKPEPFTFTPHQKIDLIWKFDEWKPSQAQLDAVNDGKNEVYFFVKDCWFSDESGHTEPLDFCRRYNQTVLSHLVYCAYDVKVE
jgi:hypothetical protein